MKKNRIFLGAFLCIIVAITGTAIWWSYGDGISEQTAFKLAENHVGNYAQQHGLDLRNYVPPSVGDQANSKVYTFSWKPKTGIGNRLTVFVDRRNIDVSITEFSEQELSDQRRN